MDCGLAGQPDEQVLTRAVQENRVLLSADTDFGEILSRSGDRTPSVILYYATCTYTHFQGERRHAESEARSALDLFEHGRPEDRSNIHEASAHTELTLASSIRDRPYGRIE